MLRRDLSIVSALALVIACDGPINAPDAGLDAAPGVDAGADAGPPDAGPDAGPPDPCAPREIEPWDLATGQWSTAFSAPGISGAFVNELLFRGGTLYAGGRFEWAGPVPARNLAAWTPAAGWRALGDGLDITVAALAVAPDGTLYAAGRDDPGDPGSTWSVHRFVDGAWSRIGTADHDVVELAIAPEGTLLAGGWLLSIDGVEVPRLAEWDGAAWSPVDHPGGSVEALRADDGEVCIGGRNLLAAYVACRRVGETAWTELHDLPAQPGPPYPTPIDDLVRTAAGDLVAVGAVVLDGTRAVGGAVRWADGAPELLGRALSGPSEYLVSSIDEDSDHALWVAGDFGSVGAYPPGSFADYAFGVARWNGVRWDVPGGVQGGYGSGARSVVAGGDDIYVGGGFGEAFGATGPFVGARNVVRWNGVGWSALPHPGASAHGTGALLALASRGSCGTFVAGDFQVVGTEQLPYVGELDEGDVVRSMSRDSVLDIAPSVLAVGADGSVYAANGWTIHHSDGTDEAAVVARWDGHTWERFGPLTDPRQRVVAMAAGSDGALYVSTADFADVTTGDLVRVTRSGAEPVGERERRAVSAIAIVGGDLVVAESVDASHWRIARFHDGAWTVMGAPFGVRVVALAEHDGTILAAGGGLTDTSLVSRWNGTAWEPLGALGAGVPAGVADLAVLGESVIAVGSFELGADGPVNAAYYRDGQWHALGGGVPSAVQQVEVTSRGVLIGGDFESAGGVASWGIARFEPADQH